MPIPHRPRLVQLLPPRVGRDTLCLADDALSAAGGGPVSPIRTTVRRGLWDSARAFLDSDGQTRILHVVGSAVWGCIGTRSPVVYTPDPAPSPSEVAALKLLARTTSLSAVTSGHTAALRRTGLAWTSVRQVEPSVPAVSASPSGSDIREQLGLEPTDHVVLALGDTDRSAGHELILWATAILAMTDPRWKLLVSGTGDALHRLRRAAVHMGTDSPDLLTVAADLEEPLSTRDLLSACDIAVYASTSGGSSVCLLEAVAAEKPILATSSATSARLLPPGLILPERRPRLLAQRLRELRDPAGLALQSNVEIVTGAALSLHDRQRAVTSRPAENPWLGLFESLSS